MVTVKLSSYSTEEVRTLYNLLSSCETQLAQSEHCTKSCPTCKLRHVCYDIAKACEFLKVELEYGCPHSAK